MTTSRSRTARGMRTQLLVADYLAANGWPHATSTGSGRSGVDVQNVPGLAIEVKARSTLAPMQWVRQAERDSEGLPLVVFRPNGMGECPEHFLTFLRLSDLVSLLRAAGYGDPEEES